MERIVAQKRDMVFNNATLTEVVTYLESNGIPTFLDRRALEDVGIAPDARVSFRHRQIRLGTGLHLLLRPLDLTWTIWRGQLLITTPEEEENHLLTRVYDVRNLVELVPAPYWPDGRGANPATVYDFDSLLELITATVAPESWDEVGGAGSIEPYWTRRMRVIVVSQTYDVHQRVEALLRKLAQLGGSTPLPLPPAFSPPAPRYPFDTGFTDVPGSRATAIRSSRLRTTGQ